MTCPKVASAGVSSTIVIRVAFPKPVISLKPSISGVAVVTSDVPSAAVPETLLGSSTVSREQYRRQVDGKRALAEGRSHQEVWVRQWTWDRSDRTDRPGWACPYWGRCCRSTG